MSPDVSVFEVSLRDGLQNESIVLPTADKLAHLRRLVDAGLRDIEVTSLVRADRVPALADAEALIRALPPTPGVRHWVLVPNLIGMERAVALGVRHVCTVVSASETHNRKNINRSVRESLAEIKRIMTIAAEEGIEVRAYVSTVFGCPYEGDVPTERTVEIASRLIEWGASTIVLGDTIGSGLPDRVQDVIGELSGVGIPLERIALHTHDTRGTALVNVYAAWRSGLTRFDASVAGIGGCPYAPGASGNLATEDLVNFFQGMGVETGVDLQGLVDAGVGIADLLGRPLPGRMHQAMGCARQRLRRSA
jgi:hydroxymethylglutaryl-CoA lyase